MIERTFAEQHQDEEEALRKRFIHHTRPQGPLSLSGAINLSSRMRGPLARAVEYHHGNGVWVVVERDGDAWRMSKAAWWTREPAEDAVDGIEEWEEWVGK